MDQSKKQVYEQDTKTGTARSFNMAQVKKYLAHELVAHYPTRDISKRLQWFGSPVAETENTCLTEVTAATNLRAQWCDTCEARTTKVKIPLEHGNLMIISREDVPLDGNVLPSQFLLIISFIGDGQIKHKARYVVGGHRDRLKNMTLLSTTVLQPQSVRVLLAL